jgi:hypothetical protein
MTETYTQRTIGHWNPVGMDEVTAHKISKGIDNEQKTFRQRTRQYISEQQQQNWKQKWPM